MSYHKKLGFKEEPFSTSPNPNYFYLTKEHETALTSILIELRLRRGLTVILGDIGTGKTTLSRKLVQEITKRGDMFCHMILDPSFENEKDFLISLIQNFNITLPSLPDFNKAGIMELRDSIEAFLIQKNIEERRSVILIIDEAQKLDLATLESLRLLLNFETNEYKLIQLVLLGQLELFAKVVNMANFYDRISFKYTLNPLGAEETKALIRFRVEKAGYNSDVPIFTDEGLSEIYNYTRGYPRRITTLCHQILKELVVQNKRVANREIICRVIEKENQYKLKKNNVIANNRQNKLLIG